MAFCCERPSLRLPHQPVCGQKDSEFIYWGCNPWLSVLLSLSPCPGQTAGCGPHRKRLEFDVHPYRARWHLGSCPCPGHNRRWPVTTDKLVNTLGSLVHHGARRAWHRLTFKALSPRPPKPPGVPSQALHCPPTETRSWLCGSFWRPAVTCHLWE